MEWAFGAELTAHLGCEKGDPGGRGSGTNRNDLGRLAACCKVGAG